MKAVIISTLFLGLAVSQSTTVWDARTKFCTVANETTACAGLQNACCGTVTTKVGSASNL